MSYAIFEKGLVLVLVLGALLFATWRLAAPFGRQKLLRRGARMFASLGMPSVAARIDATRVRQAVLQSGSPCANCGPATDKPPHGTRR